MPKESIAKITSFTQLRTWQEARTFATYIYKLTNTFPKSEMFGSTSQVRRSAVSIAANIAEGFGRNTQKGKVRFYFIALGSLAETLNHSYIGHDLGYLAEKELHFIENKGADLHKMLYGLIKSAEGRTA